MKKGGYRKRAVRKKLFSEIKNVIMEAKNSTEGLEDKVYGISRKYNKEKEEKWEQKDKIKNTILEV